MPDVVRIWRIRRAGAAARPLEVSLGYQPRDSRSTVVVVPAETKGGRWRAGPAASLAELRAYDAWGHGYAAGPAAVRTPGRPGTVLQMCAVATVDTATLTQQPNTYDWFVASVNTEVSITLKTPGWTVNEVTADSGAGLRVLRTYDGSGSGVELGARRTVEHFTGVVAPGGRYGSVAFARLPCDAVRESPGDPAGSRRTGVGAATLLGGDATPDPTFDRHLACGANDVSALAAAHAPTTWALRGEAVGASASLNRLTVFDFPKR